MERDHPLGHPAASDYKGEAYTPPRAPYAEDFAPGHPARDGANCTVLASPDGMRAAFNETSADLQEMAMIGSLPPLLDPATHEPVQLTPQQLAHVYAVRNGLSAELAKQVTAEYGLASTPARATDAPAATLTAEEQAVAYIVALGYTPERAKELLDKYGVPSVIQDKQADAHR